MSTILIYAIMQLCYAYEFMTLKSIYKIIMNACYLMILWYLNIIHTYVHVFMDIY